MDRPPVQDTRQALIEEAIAALRELTPADLVSAVGVKEIARRAGVGVTTVYHHFGNLGGFADAVVARVFDPGEFPIEQITAHVEQVTAAAFPAEVSLTLHGAELDRLTTDPEFRVRMGLWALGGEATDQVYGEFLRSIDSVLARYSTEMFNTWGREMRPPYDMRTFVAVHTALLNGSSIRTLVDPGALDRERYAQVASALSLIIARLEGDRRTLDDQLSELNYLPIRRMKGTGLGEQRQQTRDRVLEAAATLFGTEGYHGATVPYIAQAADLSKSTVYELFDDVADIATHVLRRNADALVVADDPDVEPLPDGEPLLSTLTTLAQFLGGQAPISGAYGARLLAGTLPMPDPLVHRMRQAVETVTAAHAPGPRADAQEIAEMLTTLLVARVTANPSASPAQVASQITALVLPGLQAGESRTPQT